MQDVGPLDEVEHDLDPRGVLEVERDDGRPRLRMSWSAGATSPAPPRAVDADDVGAEIGEHHRRERARPDAGELDDADAGRGPEGGSGHATIVTVSLSRLSSGVGHVTMTDAVGSCHHRCHVPRKGTRMLPDLVYTRRGSGTPLVLLHGIGHRREAWDPVLDRLAEHFDVIAPDLSGFGQSPAFAGGSSYTMENACDHIADQFAEWGVTEAARRRQLARRRDRARARRPRPGLARSRRSARPASSDLVDRVQALVPLFLLRVRANRPQAGAAVPPGSDGPPARSAGRCTRTRSATTPRSSATPWR